jgi:hypothetical protein
MKNLIRSTIVSLLLGAACMAYGAGPSLNVTVSDASGKAAFKGSTNAKGTFATSKLKPGNYVVQFSSPGGGLKGNYAIVVSAGMKKVSAAGVAGEKFAKGGVALKVDVAAGLNIAGQVAAEEAGASKNGKKMVWIPPQSGSHMPGKWVEADSAEAKQVRASGSLSAQDVNNIQEHMHNPQGGN